MSEHSEEPKKVSPPRFPRFCCIGQRFKQLYKCQLSKHKHNPIDDPKINHATSERKSSPVFASPRAGNKSKQGERKLPTTQKKASPSCSSLNLIPLKVNQPFSFHFRPRAMEGRKKIGKQFLPHQKAEFFLFSRFNKWETCSK